MKRNFFRCPKCNSTNCDERKKHPKWRCSKCKEEFSNRIKDKIEFVIEPYIRFKGKTGEQATMFFLDPDNNALDVKAFKNDKMIFEK